MSPLILAAPAAFKGTLGPRQVAEALAAGVRQALPEASVLQCPLSDGGDGLLDAVLPRGSLRERLKVTGPLGEPVSGELGWLDAETAIFESATACGIALLKPEELDPLHASTRGVGELIWEAVEGARRRWWWASAAPPPSMGAPARRAAWGGRSATRRARCCPTGVAPWRRWRSCRPAGRSRRG